MCATLWTIVTSLCIRGNAACFQSCDILLRWNDYQSDPDRDVIVNSRERSIFSTVLYYCDEMISNQIPEVKKTFGLFTFAIKSAPDKWYVIVPSPEVKQSDADIMLYVINTLNTHKSVNIYKLNIVIILIYILKYFMGFTDVKTDLKEPFVRPWLQ